MDLAHDDDFELGDWSDELNALVSGEAEITVLADDAPLPSPWQDGGPWQVVGARTVAMRGLVVLIRIAPGRNEWDFHISWGDAIASLLRRRLPYRCGWRVAFEVPTSDGFRRVSLAVVGQCRLGEALINPPSTRVSQAVIPALSSISLVDDVLDKVVQVLDSVFRVEIRDQARQLLRRRIESFINKLPYSNGSAIGSAALGRIEEALDGILTQLDRSRSAPDATPAIFHFGAFAEAIATFAKDRLRCDVDQARSRRLGVELSIALSRLPYREPEILEPDTLRRLEIVFSAIQVRLNVVFPAQGPVAHARAST